MNQDKKVGSDRFLVLARFVEHLGLCFRYSLRQAWELGRPLWVNYALGLLLCLVLSVRETHLSLLHHFLPDLFTENLVIRLSLISTFNQFLMLGISFTLLVLYTLGFRYYSSLKRCERAFRKVGIRNSLGEYPKVLEHTRVADLRSKYRLLLDGIDVNEFTLKSSALETSLKAMIEEVRREEDPQFVELYLTRKKIPKKVLYSDITQTLTAPHSFLVGKSLSQVLTQDVAALPHMLIAGTTGGGKSIFVIQVTVGLLESTPGLQVYLLDLKNGLELGDFAASPNVSVVKSVSESLVLLTQIRDEMRARFIYLEKNGRKRIDPEKDPFDRIVVCIDEASVLYGTGRVNPTDKENALKASEITDEIAKLSRAAAIHLILATQKVTKETINTHIQENLEGRMCFEVNSIQGSNMVIGNGSAKDLPHIPGRGIWRCGATLVEVQTPYLSEKEVVERVAQVAEEFKIGKRQLQQKMFSPKEFGNVAGETVVKMTTPKEKRKDE